MRLGSAGEALAFWGHFVPQVTPTRTQGHTPCQPLRYSLTLSAEWTLDGAGRVTEYFHQRRATLRKHQGHQRWYRKRPESHMPFLVQRHRTKPASQSLGTDPDTVPAQQWSCSRTRMGCTASPAKFTFFPAPQNATLFANSVFADVGS